MKLGYLLSESLIDFSHVLQEMMEKISGTLESSSQGIQIVENPDVRLEDHLSRNGSPSPAPTVVPVSNAYHKREVSPYHVFWNLEHSSSFLCLKISLLFMPISFCFDPE